MPPVRALPFCEGWVDGWVGEGKWNGRKQAHSARCNIVMNKPRRCLLHWTCDLVLPKVGRNQQIKVQLNWMYKDSSFMNRCRVRTKCSLNLIRMVLTSSRSELQNPSKKTCSFNIVGEDSGSGSLGSKDMYS
jgi:hypothetical protein